jgi:hypothetical protein
LFFDGQIEGFTKEYEMKELIQMTRSPVKKTSTIHKLRKYLV